mmetsp:Transcript_57921/g.116360  ORF Transcript_57921/g.116360 Transcript_57921/m.116360 type:complete len:101 (+) Transcript_57921:688-990(+)
MCVCVMDECLRVASADLKLALTYGDGLWGRMHTKKACGLFGKRRRMNKMEVDEAPRALCGNWLHGVDAGNSGICASRWKRTHAGAAPMEQRRIGCEETAS